MADLSDFQQYYKLADILIEQASKEQLAECALDPDEVVKKDGKSVARK